LIKLNKYQKLILILYGISFIYFSAIHVPFKVYGRQEIIYDTLFSERANLDASRLILILVVVSVAFAIIHFLINSLRLDYKPQIGKKLKTKPFLYILVGLVIITATVYILTRNKNLFAKIEHVSSDTVTKSAILNTISRPVEQTQSKPSYYKITNIKTYNNELFEESVSFNFINISDQVISNVMFEEAYFPVRHKKNDFTNKTINLNPKDSLKFVFKKNHDELFVYKIRFSSGSTISLGDPDNDLLNYENMIYTKLLENKN
jgi:hypothetical protein